MPAAKGGSNENSWCSSRKGQIALITPSLIPCLVPPIKAEMVQLTIVHQFD
jgi:hypothetical protein